MVVGPVMGPNGTYRTRETLPLGSNFICEYEVEKMNRASQPSRTAGSPYIYIPQGPNEDVCPNDSYPLTLVPDVSTQTDVPLCIRGTFVTNINECPDAAKIQAFWRQQQTKSQANIRPTNIGPKSQTNTVPVKSATLNVTQAKKGATNPKAGLQAPTTSTCDLKPLTTNVTNMSKALKALSDKIDSVLQQLSALNTAEGGGKKTRRKRRSSMKKTK